MIYALVLSRSIKRAQGSSSRYPSEEPKKALWVHASRVKPQKSSLPSGRPCTWTSYNYQVCSFLDSSLPAAVRKGFLVEGQLSRGRRQSWTSTDWIGLPACGLPGVFNNMNGALPHIKCACLLPQLHLSHVTGSVHLDMLWLFCRKRHI